MIQTLHKAVDLIGREHRGRWILLVLLALVVSGFEMLGAILVFVLVGLVADPSGQIDLPLVGDIRALVSDLDERTLLLRTVLVIALFFVLRGLVQIGSVYAQKRVAENAGARLSNRLVEGYLRWPYPVHLRRNSAELIRNAHQAVQQLVGQVFVPLINVTAAGFLTFGMLAVLLAIAPVATGIAVLVVGGAALMVLLVVQPRMKRLGLTAHRMQRETLTWLQQSLHGIRDIKILGRERYFARQYGKSRLRLAHASYLRATMSQLPSTIIESALIGFILLFFGITVLAGDGAEGALPVLGLFAYVGLRLQPSLQRIIGGLNDIKFATAPLDDLHTDLMAVEALPVFVAQPDPLPFEDIVTLEDVEFSYEGTDRAALTQISLTIRSGEQIGICGPTGGGKTTLVDLITGLLEPTSGRVTIDGLDLREHARAWHQNLGVVPQVVFLVDDTLQRNIALGIPDGQIDDDTLHEAVGLAQLKEFVESLPEGLETVVGERGVRISGGQRQRIAIARALYRRPAVLIFDEGTSALDTETEAKLMESIESLRGSHTIILIAHRLSTVRKSDRVVFIEDGRIAGIGTFAELERDNERFRAMASSS